MRESNYPVQNTYVFNKQIRWRPSEYKPVENKGYFIEEAGSLGGND